MEGRTLITPTDFARHWCVSTCARGTFNGPFAAHVEVWEAPFDERPSFAWIPRSVTVGVVPAAFRWAHTKGGTLIVRVRSAGVVQAGVSVTMHLARIDGEPRRAAVAVSWSRLELAPLPVGVHHG